MENTKEEKPTCEPPVPPFPALSPDPPKNTHAPPSYPIHIPSFGQTHVFGGVSNQLSNTGHPYHFMSTPASFGMFHPGYNIPGYNCINSAPNFPFLQSNFNQITPSPLLGDPNNSQSTLSSIHEVVSDLNKKMEDMENQLKKTK